MERNSIVCYNRNMSDILLIGKDLPESLDLAEGFTSQEKGVFAVCKTDAEVSDFESNNIFASVWNRPSAISARSLIIKAETKFQNLTDFVLVFDAYQFGTEFELDRTEDIAKAIDTMIAGYQYFINELLYRLEQRKEEVTVTFLVKNYPSKYEVAVNGNKNVNLHPISNIVNSAMNAFTALAEGISTIISDRSYISVLLAKCDPSNELYNDDKQIGTWIAQSIEAIRGMKNKQSVKQAATWVKVGGKVPTGFGLFK